MEHMNRVANYVGARVAKVLVGARRANNYNAALVGELKRWNRKLEVLAQWSDEKATSCAYVHATPHFLLGGRSQGGGVG